MKRVFDNLRSGVAGCMEWAGQQMYADVYASPTIYLDYNVPKLHAKVDSLDELILIFTSDSAIRLDTDLGWHMYGADAHARAKKLEQDALVIYNRVVHHTKRTEFDPKFYELVEIFRAKNPGPIKTTTISIHKDGSVISP